MRDFLGELQTLLLQIVRSLIDEPPAASVQVNRDVLAVTLIVRVAPKDVGKVIGKEGRMARSIRVITAAIAQKHKHPLVAIDIVPNASRYV
jgi:predicted RNA-binding protein YlqC (UPF0109 family)